MIEKIGFKGVNTKGVSQETMNCEPNKPCGVRNDLEVMSKESSDALKAIAFQGNIKIEAKSGEETTFHIKDFLDISDTVSVSDGKKANFTFTKIDNGIVIKANNGAEIFKAQFNDPSFLPDVTLKAGKYKPEITIHDDSLDGGRIQMFEGSKIEADNFSLVMPGVSKGYGKGKDISFEGRTLVTTLNKEVKTKEAVDKYFKSGLASQTTKGDYADFMKEQDPTIAIPAGGFGTRFENMTEEEGENKPSFRLPTDNNYRIMATALNMGAMAGLTGSEGDSLVYASQAKAGTDGALDESENVKKVGQFKTDGGAIYEALDKGYIPQDKDLIVLNADIITNADITRAYHALKTLPNAALVIPYYPVDAKRAQSFGLMGLNKDENGNMQIKDFIEKPPYTDEEPPQTGFKATNKYNTYDKVYKAYKDVNESAKLDDGRYYGNPGIYVMSKEAANVLREMGVEDPGKTGLGADVMPQIVKLCQEGKLKDANGNPMKAYTVPLERKGGEPAFWDDIGSAEAYLKTIKEFAQETDKKGTGPDNRYYGIPEFVLNDFNKNFDQETSVLYMSDKAKENAGAFSEKYGAKIEGNVFIADQA